MSTKIDNTDFLVSNLKNLLQEKLWLLEERLRQKRLNSPYKHITNAEARVFATLRGEILTISEVARKLEVSRQAVHKIVSALIKANLLKLESIPGNSRDKRIVFTQKGEDLKKEAGKALRELEQKVETALGTKNFALLKSLLGKQW